MRRQAGRKAGRQEGRQSVKSVLHLRCERDSICRMYRTMLRGAAYKHITSQMQKPNPIYESHASLAIEMPDPGGQQYGQDARCTAPAPLNRCGCSALLCFAPSPHTHHTSDDGQMAIRGEGAWCRSPLLHILRCDLGRNFKQTQSPVIGSGI